MPDKKDFRHEIKECENNLISETILQFILYFKVILCHPALKIRIFINARVFVETMSITNTSRVFLHIQNMIYSYNYLYI